MDRIGLKILEEELERDAEVLAGASTKARGMLEEESVGHLPACGFELNRFYNVLEKSFERVAEAFENHFEKRGDYHERLIERMNLSIEGIRPALLGDDLVPAVRELKGFRHVFRHAYDLTIDPDRLKPLVAHAEKLAASFPELCGQFIRKVLAELES